MRTKTIDDTTIEYPDEICFCFNPVVMNVYGHAWAFVEVTVTDTASNVEHKEKRAMFGSSCFFDVSFYMQSAFDATEFGKIDYTKTGAQDSQLGRLFSVEVDLYSNNSTIGNSFQFNTFIIWGAMKVGERFESYPALRWFKNLPFTVGIYIEEAINLIVKSDGTTISYIPLQERKAYNIMLTGIDADYEVLLCIPSEECNSVFDFTFDFTFHSLVNTERCIRLIVDNCTDGIYLRWIDRLGRYCYYLFKGGNDNMQVSNDGEYLRNNMQEYRFIDHYHYGKRMQRKSDEHTLSICAPLVDSYTFDFLNQITMSPIVDMYRGKDDNGVDVWEGVNISSGSYNKTRAVLQDFVANIILPETRVQSL